MLTDITLGQYFPGTSFLHKLDPRAKILGDPHFYRRHLFCRLPGVVRRRDGLCRIELRHIPSAD